MTYVKLNKNLHFIYRARVLLRLSVRNDIVVAYLAARLLDAVARQRTSVTNLLSPITSRSVINFLPRWNWVHKNKRFPNLFFFFSFSLERESGDRTPVGRFPMSLSPRDSFRAVVREKGTDREKDRKRKREKERRDRILSARTTGYSAWNRRSAESFAEYDCSKKNR